MLRDIQIGFWGATIEATGQRARSTGWSPQHGSEEFIGDVISETRRLAVKPIESYGRLLDYSN